MEKRHYGCSPTVPHLSEVILFETCAGVRAELQQWFRRCRPCAGQNSTLCRTRRSNLRQGLPLDFSDC